MDEAAARVLVAEQAEVLRGLSRRMATHGIGEKWEGTARRACEDRLRELQHDLHTEARGLDMLAQWANVSSVRAHLG